MDPTVTALDSGGDPFGPDVALPDFPGYETLGRLGSGGMGFVYRARQRDRDRHVAIKVIPASREAHFLQLARFRIEAEAVACLNHPNIIRIHQIGVHQGLPFLVFELAGGEGLDTRIGDRPQPPRWSAEVSKTLAGALSHAHGRGILHRDLKPSNVLFLADGTLKVTDFGLAKFTRSIDDVSSEYCTMTARDFDILLRSQQLADDQLKTDLESRYRSNPEGAPTFEEFAVRTLWNSKIGPTDLDSTLGRESLVRDFVAEARQQALASLGASFPDAVEELTRDGAVMGSPGYMAPEQILGDLSRIGPQTDVYALGCLLYQMLAGRPPFTGGIARRMQATLQLPPPPLDVDVPRDLEAIARKCLEKRGEDRYGSADELAEDLGRYLDGATVRAPSPCSTPGVVANLVEKTTGGTIAETLSALWKSRPWKRP
ncbi:serine/threonine-protein kinase [Singulisphaera rosea]